LDVEAALPGGEKVQPPTTKSLLPDAAAAGPDRPEGMLRLDVHRSVNIVYCSFNLPYVKGGEKPEPNT
jgi:hypothetical protein